MTADALHVLAAARIAHADLTEIDRQLRADAPADDHFVVLVKQALITVANLVDLEAGVRSFYQRHPKVSEEFKRWRRQFEFAKYVRNILVGHTNPALVAKAVEWKPELRTLLLVEDPGASLLVNLGLLETAINTYVDDAEKHLLFDGDTDLGYPPDWTRFLMFLTEIVRGGLSFLTTLITAVRSEAPPSPTLEANFVLARIAGATTFVRITKNSKP